MEQISLEDKVSNTLKWLANQIACIQVYHWSEEYKEKSLNDAWQKVQEQFKKDIDWNALTESQCKALRFGSWQSEEEVEEEISCLQSELDKGHLTKEEFDKKVSFFQELIKTLSDIVRHINKHKVSIRLVRSKTFHFGKLFIEIFFVFLHHLCNSFIVFRIFVRNLAKLF